MELVALLIALLVVAMGVLGMVSPDRLLTVIRLFERPGGLLFAGAIRVVFGVALYLAAPDARVPEVLRVLAVISFVAGLVTPMLGVERIGRVIDWWTARPVAGLRAWAAVAMAFGLFVVWALVSA